MTEKQKQKTDRMAEMVRMRQAGVAHEQIAQCFGVSTKTVQRTLKASGQFSLPDSFYRCKPKEQQFLIGVSKGLTKRQAALDAGYSESMADNAGKEILGRGNVRRAAVDLARAALTDEEFIALLRDGAFATQTNRYTHQGRIVAERTDVDLGMRHRYLELIGKMGGLLKQEGEVTVPVQVIVDL